MTSEAMDHEVISVVNKMKAGEEIPVSKHCVRERFSIGADGIEHIPEPLPTEDPATEFEDYPLEEKAPTDWQGLLMKICRSVAIPASLGVLMLWAMLRGYAVEEFALPFSWACSLIAVFSAGLIVARSGK